MPRGPNINWIALNTYRTFDEAHQAINGYTPSLSKMAQNSTSSGFYMTYKCSVKGCPLRRRYLRSNIDNSVEECGNGHDYNHSFDSSQVGRNGTALARNKEIILNLAPMKG